MMTWMRRNAMLAAVAAATLAGIAGCGGDNASEPDRDTTAPAAVADLRIEATGCEQVKLAWTSPGDDGSQGKASFYDVRYSTGTITTANWASATQCQSEPAPKTAGQAESFVVSGLTPGETYYFAVASGDDAGNGSDLSNNASTTTVNQTTIGWVNDGTGPDEDWWTSSSSLSARWAIACVSEYEYTLGTGAGATDVIGWTSAGTETQVTRSGLALAEGQTYYWSVRGVRDAVPGASTSSDGITVDTTEPVSQVTALAATTTTRPFAVAWTGSDAGSGLSGYDIQVKEDDGPWTDWLTATALIESDFTGQIDHAYAFRSRAHDVAGNVEAYPGNPDASTVLTCSYAFSLQWGDSGSAEGQFHWPLDIAVSPTGGVYVAESENNRVQFFDADGNFQGKWGEEGGGPGQFHEPHGVAVDDSGYVYVSDFFNHRVQKFTADGAFVAKWGSQGTGEDQMIYPRGITVDDSFYVYVAEQGNERIHKFTSNGVSVKTWGVVGTGQGEFRGLLGVAAAPSGDIYALDSYNARIQQFTSSGSFIRAWGSYGSGAGQFSGLAFIAVDPQGYVYTTESGGHRVQRFTADGRFLTKWGSFGTGDGEFNQAYGIAAGLDGEVYVTDLLNFRVQKFLATCPY